MSDQVFWFATRSAGILAWFTASISVIIGLMMSSRVLGRRPTIPWLTDLHRYFGAMSMVFLAVHMATLWLDEFVSFRWRELLIPGVADVPGLPSWSLALGVVAAWLLTIVELSSLVKDYLPKRFWHTLHLGSFGVVAAGLIHGLQAGSDADNLWLAAVSVSVLTGMVILTASRVLRVLGERKYRHDLAQQQAAATASRSGTGEEADDTVAIEIIEDEPVAFDEPYSYGATAREPDSLEPPAPEPVLTPLRSSEPAPDTDGSGRRHHHPPPPQHRAPRRSRRDHPAPR